MQVNFDAAARCDHDVERFGLAFSVHIVQVSTRRDGGPVGMLLKQAHRLHESTVCSGRSIITASESGVRRYRALVKVAHGRIVLSGPPPKARQQVRDHLTVRGEVRHLATGLPKPTVTGFVLGPLVYARPRLARGSRFVAGEMFSLALRGLITSGPDGATLSYSISRPWLSVVLPWFVRGRQGEERALLDEWSRQLGADR